MSSVWRDLLFEGSSMSCNALAITYGILRLRAIRRGLPALFGDPCTFYFPLWATSLLIYVGWGLAGNAHAWFDLTVAAGATAPVVVYFVREHRAGRHGPRPPRRRRRLAVRRLARDGCP